MNQTSETFPLIREITDLDAIGTGTSTHERKYSVRKAARAVLKDEQNRIALLHVKNLNYYKLPGGGVKPGETIEEGLKRELLEETGCRSKILHHIGVVVEYRHFPNRPEGIIQFSYCFEAEVSGEKAGLNLTKKEQNDGFELIWRPLSEALKLVTNANTQDYEGKFIKLRDAAFLSHYHKHSSD